MNFAECLELTLILALPFGPVHGLLDQILFGLFYSPLILYFCLPRPQNRVFEYFLWLVSLPTAALQASVSHSSPLNVPLKLIVVGNVVQSICHCLPSAAIAEFVWCQFRQLHPVLAFHLQLCRVFHDYVGSSFSFVERTTLSALLSALALGGVFATSSDSLLTILNCTTNVFLAFLLVWTFAAEKLGSVSQSYAMYAPPILALGSSCLWLSFQLHINPAIWLKQVLLEQPESALRLRILCWWIACLFIAGLLVSVRSILAIKLRCLLPNQEAVLNFHRKLYHGLVVVMFLPTLSLDPFLAHLSFSLAALGFQVVEYVRAYRIAPFGAIIHDFLWQFTDRRDHKGTLIISHLYLLLGCALPVWLSLAAGSSARSIDLLLGVLCLGCGDAMASLVGKRFGRIRIRHTSKTVEGTLAFMLAVLVPLLLLSFFEHVQTPYWLHSVLLSFAAALMESVSRQNDNLLLPIYCWTVSRAFTRTSGCPERSSR
ncbi:dolichol kinase [Schizosaccharomyces japonicus yFS275]|uniref:dolichol kinase n=1 Tax=Schizosaccharomyces japonicus (strain yFS275 / FY16936) TaxID=402676 RepID=B6K6A3_SCHJY|nr:dolichol kinase [Schizosaccharomyces japonicus yFS275]EEB09057.1 dolichol kinase [Schizosaccharomyces japonicus yFS275]